MFAFRAKLILLSVPFFACLNACSKPPIPDARVTDSGCEPSYVNLANESIVVKPDPYIELGAKLAMIGCATDLERITASQRDTIAEHLRALLAQKHLLLGREVQSLGFRRSFAAKINEIVGQPVVTDVLVYGLYSKDLAPSADG